MYHLEYIFHLMLKTNEVLISLEVSKNLGFKNVCDTRRQELWL